MSNKLAAVNDRRMTLRQAAEIIGKSLCTARKYAQKAGWTKKGKATLLNEEQVTVILEAMKQRRKGCIYWDRTDKGGKKKKPHNRYRAEIQIEGKLYRRRDRTYGVLEGWLKTMTGKNRGSYE